MALLTRSWRVSGAAAGFAGLRAVSSRRDFGVEGDLSTVRRMPPVGYMERS